MSALFVALMVAASGTIAPLLLASLTARQRRQEREAEWERQDEIHARDKADRERDTKEINGQLKVIHKLVNGNVTAYLKREYAGTVRELELMKELGKPDAAIELIERKLVDLKSVLDDRARQTELAEKQSLQIQEQDNG